MLANISVSNKFGKKCQIWRDYKKTAFQNWLSFTDWRNDERQNDQNDDAETETILGFIGTILLLHGSWWWGNKITELIARVLHFLLDAQFEQILFSCSVPNRFGRTGSDGGPVPVSQPHARLSAAPPRVPHVCTRHQLRHHGFLCGSVDPEPAYQRLRSRPGTHDGVWDSIWVHINNSPIEFDWWIVAHMHLKSLDRSLLYFTGSKTVSCRSLELHVNSQVLAVLITMLSFKATFARNVNPSVTCPIVIAYPQVMRN